MLFNNLLFLLLIVRNLIIAQHDRIVIDISAILGKQLLFNTDILDKLANDQYSKTFAWYKGIHKLKPLINSENLSNNFITITELRYYLINGSKLLIKTTLIGDEGFYTLKVQTKLNISKIYIFHVILFSQTLSLSISPPSYPPNPYHAEQKVNCTCSISFYTDRTYIEQSRSVFFSTWSMIIYNNDPDYYQILSSTSSASYTYIAYLINYELNRNDHNQLVFCTLIQQNSQQISLHNISLINSLNIEYKAYLRGNYYFIRSFNAYSTIEINCEEFDANPKPVYTLIWSLNGLNQTLLNKTKHGRYFITNATWKNRGNYTCLAENYLNKQQPALQSFRLNIWFNEHQLNSEKTVSLQPFIQSRRNKSIILISLISIFIFASFLFILSLYCYCLQIKYK